jgi:hypothetical protein
MQSHYKQPKEWWQQDKEQVEFSKVLAWNSSVIRNKYPKCDVMTAIIDTMLYALLKLHTLLPVLYPQMDFLYPLYRCPNQINSFVLFFQILSIRFNLLLSRRLAWNGFKLAETKLKDDSDTEFV